MSANDRRTAVYLPAMDWQIVVACLYAACGEDPLNSKSVAIWKAGRDRANYIADEIRRRVPAAEGER